MIVLTNSIRMVLAAQNFKANCPLHVQVVVEVENKEVSGVLETFWNLLQLVVAQILAV